MNFHPAADLFPMMDDADLHKLADDITTNGQLEAITIYDGAILDGRNRYRACGILGIEPKFKYVNGEVSSPVNFVVSHNLHRRHLTPSQRAAIAAEIIPMLADEAKRRQISTLKNQTHSSLVPIGTNEEGRSRSVVGKMMGVGETSVSRAVRIKRENPQVFEQVKRGEISAWAADESIPKHKQPVKPGPVYQVSTHRQKLVAEANKRKMTDGLALIGGVCTGLDTLKLQVITAVCSQEEIKTWSEKALNHARQLRNFAYSLRKQGDVNGKYESSTVSEDAGGSVDAASPSAEGN